MMKKNNNDNNKDNSRSSWLKPMGIFLGGILGGMILLIIVGAFPTLLKNLPKLFKELIPSFKVVLGYIYIGIIAFIAGRFSQK